MHRVQRATDEFAVRLAKDRKWLPDLLFFRDDLLATGAFVALLDAGVRIPADVRVATGANKGLGPPFPRPLTRMVLDNAAVGKRLASCVLEYLRTGTFPQGVTVGPDYVKGDTL
jgi:DNA-binding LacI/PurR family transcriptional regulator